MTGDDLKTYPLPEIIAFARANCPFYRSFYAGAPDDPAIETLPIIEPDEFWEAHARDRREILSAGLQPALVINSGGTTGLPKNSYFTGEEWFALAALSAWAFAGTGVQDGDCVANLFAAGDLHGSFLFVAASLRDAFPNAMQIPLGDCVPPDRVIGALKTFGVNVLAGFPTPLLRLIEGMDPAKDGVHLRRILYAGETFSEDQRIYLDRKYPGITIHSVGYGGVDAGLLGHSSADCGLSIHRAFDGATILEIVDEETGLVIEETGQPGRLIATNLMRRLMPIIRYPTGDMAQWTDPPGTAGRRFRLLGRAQESARISNINVTVAGTRALLSNYQEKLGITHFQLLVTREHRLDQLTLRVVANATPEELAAAKPGILRELVDSNPESFSLLETGVIHPFKLEWISVRELVVTERTGKTRLVVDRRAG